MSAGLPRTTREKGERMVGWWEVTRLFAGAFVVVLYMRRNINLYSVLSECGRKIYATHRVQCQAPPLHHVPSVQARRGRRENSRSGMVNCVSDEGERHRDDSGRTRLSHDHVLYRHNRAAVLRSQDKLNVLDYTTMVIITKVCLRSQRRIADNNSRR